jgi:hypothetical protein
MFASFNEARRQVLGRDAAAMEPNFRPSHWTQLLIPKCDNSYLIAEITRDGMRVPALPALVVGGIYKDNHGQFYYNVTNSPKSIPQADEWSIAYIHQVDYCNRQLRKFDTSDFSPEAVALADECWRSYFAHAYWPKTERPNLEFTEDHWTLVNFVQVILDHCEFFTMTDAQCYVIPFMVEPDILHNLPDYTTVIDKPVTLLSLLRRILLNDISLHELYAELIRVCENTIRYWQPRNGPGFVNQAKLFRSAIVAVWEGEVLAGGLANCASPTLTMARASSQESVTPTEHEDRDGESADEMAFAPLRQPVGTVEFIDLSMFD